MYDDGLHKPVILGCREFEMTHLSVRNVDSSEVCMYNIACLKIVFGADTYARVVRSTLHAKSDQQPHSPPGGGQ